MQPDFEQLLQIIRLLAQKAEVDFVRVVLASKDGDVSFIEVTDGADLRAELQDAVGGGMLALGMLGWQLEGKTIQARSFLFSWHQDDENLAGLFERLCEAGVDSVQAEFDRRIN